VTVSSLAFLMDARLAAGTLSAYLYNDWVGILPSRRIRKFYLSFWLGRLGKGSSVMMNVRFLNGRKIHIGQRNVINRGCVLDGRRYTISTGDDVSIGPETVILTLGHDPMCPNFSDRGADVVIGNRAWIGYRALILPGVTLGEGCVVGAGSVVAKNVDPYTVIAGNPAKRIRERSRAMRYELDYDPFLE